jgi:hypothetical protein
MNFKMATVGGIACLVFAQAALAAGRDRLSYTGVEATFGRSTQDDASAGADRLGLHASLDLGRQLPLPVFVSASREQAESDEVGSGSSRYSTKSSLSRVDLGLHFGSDRTANFVPSISLVEARGEFLGSLAWIGDFEESGWAARGAVRALVKPWLELGASVEMMFISEDETSTVAAEGILYPFSHLGVGVGYEMSRSLKTVSARARIVL